MKKTISPWKNIAYEYIAEESEEIFIFAESLSKKRIKTHDSLHISFAVFANCNYHLTTDKKLLNIPTQEIKIINPIMFENEMKK